MQSFASILKCIFEERRHSLRITRYFDQTAYTKKYEKVDLEKLLKYIQHRKSRAQLNVIPCTASQHEFSGSDQMQMVPEELNIRQLHPGFVNFYPSAQSIHTRPIHETPDRILGNDKFLNLFTIGSLNILYKMVTTKSKPSTTTTLNTKNSQNSGVVNRISNVRGISSPM